MKTKFKISILILAIAGVTAYGFLTSSSLEAPSRYVVIIDGVEIQYDDYLEKKKKNFVRTTEELSSSLPFVNKFVSFWGALSQ